MALRRITKADANFSMSSMTDIVFLLLIFFLVTSTLVNPNALKLLLPKSTGQVGAKATASVSIKDWGDDRYTFHINGDEMPVPLSEVEVSDFGLAKQLDVGRKEAAGYIDSYFERYTGVKKYMEDIVAKAREQGYVSTLMGRRRYLPEIRNSNFNLRSFAERTAINTPIQGTAADIMKKAMIAVQRELDKAQCKSRILLQVHDELVLEVTEDEKEQAAQLVRTAMEGAASLDIPLLADVNCGRDWAETK